MADFEGAEEDGVEGAEDYGVGADACAEEGHGYQGESGRLG